MQPWLKKKKKRKNISTPKLLNGSAGEPELKLYVKYTYVF